MGKLREKSGRRPPWNATKKQAEAFSRERAFKNRVHELEQELTLVTADRQRLTETNVRLGVELAELKRRPEIVHPDAHVQIEHALDLQMAVTERLVRAIVLATIKDAR